MPQSNPTLPNTGPRFVVYATPLGFQPPVYSRNFEYVWWRPSWLSLIPATLGLRFAIWTIFHYLKVFRNDGYSVLYILDSQKIVHRSCLIPAYFRWPFMGKGDLQISSTWTDPNYRGRGLATNALGKILSEYCKPGRRFWYISREANVPSISVAKNAGFEFVSYARRFNRFGVSFLGKFVLIS